MQLIDTHFHLDFYRDHAYWYEKINELRQYTLCVTNSPGVYHSCKQLYKETKYIKFALGYNPQQSLSEPFPKNLFLHEIQGANYIGEVGLDLSKNYVLTRKAQFDAFDFICHIGAKQNKLLSVHSRKAERETLDILLKNNVTRAIIHWYTGDIESITRFIDAGYYFSVNASMCATSSGREIIAKIPLERMLVESDGPFSKIGKKKYTPLYLYEIYSAIMDVTGQKDLEMVIWENFKHLLTDCSPNAN